VRALLLWDVDHTLIENGGVSKANYRLAFELLVGRAPEVGPRTHGRTDVAITEQLLIDNGEDPDRFPWDVRCGALIEAGQRNQPDLARLGHALAGAEATLERLDQANDVIQSVLTGNIEQNARLKLGTFGLDRWLDFSVGGFGSSSRVRADLVPVAQGRALAKYDVSPSRDVTVLVGDTILDVEAGLAGGARVIGVATGTSSSVELAAAGADVVLADLTDVDAFVQALDRLRAIGPLVAQKPQDGV
jgi:phosphoglycolate phosphatase